MTATLEAPTVDAAAVIASIPQHDFDALFADTPASLSNAVAMARIKAALERRSGHAWTVEPCGPDGLRIVVGPRRTVVLARLLDRPATCIEPGGQYVPAGRYRDEYVARAEGRTPSVYGGVLNHPAIRALARSQGWT